MYYGGEILMTGREHDGHGNIREDFPGGWPDDKVSAFGGDGLSCEQKEALGFTMRLLNWRKTNEVVQFGEFTQYIPQNGVYVYFRHNEKASVMILLNNSEDDRKVNLSRFANNLNRYTKGKSVLTRTSFDKLDLITVPAKSPLIIELIK